MNNSVDFSTADVHGTTFQHPEHDLCQSLSGCTHKTNNANGQPGLELYTSLGMDLGNFLIYRRCFPVPIATALGLCISAMYNSWLSPISGDSSEHHNGCCSCNWNATDNMEVKHCARYKSDGHDPIWN